jgi:hypothetical protein
LLLALLPVDFLQRLLDEIRHGWHTLPLSLTLSKQQKSYFVSRFVSAHEPNFNFKSPRVAGSKRLLRVPIGIASEHCESVDRRRRAVSDCRWVSATRHAERDF